MDVGEQLWAGCVHGVLKGKPAGVYSAEQLNNILWNEHKPIQTAMRNKPALDSWITFAHELTMKELCGAWVELVTLGRCEWPSILGAIVQQNGAFTTRTHLPKDYETEYQTLMYFAKQYDVLPWLVNIAEYNDAGKFDTDIYKGWNGTPSILARIAKNIRDVKGRKVLPYVMGVWFLSGVDWQP
jgi:hypothetical protein